MSHQETLQIIEAEEDGVSGMETPDSADAHNCSKTEVGGHSWSLNAHHKAEAQGQDNNGRQRKLEHKEIKKGVR